MQSERDLILAALVGGADPRWVTARLTSLALPEVQPRVCARAIARTPGGRPISFDLAITVIEGSVLKVTELEPRRIPRFCPDRHLFDDGSFCMGFGMGTAPTTREAARVWWRLLGGYLDMQIEAQLLGEWDPLHAWPHGSGAKFLKAAEEIEARLPAKIAERSRAEDELPTPNTKCSCGTGRRAKHCHLPVLQHTRRLRHLAQAGDKDYWRFYSDRPCCGTLKFCPLRNSTPVYLRSRHEYLGGPW